MTHEIYISYTQKDKPIADQILSDLEKRGIRCWMAPRDLQPGMSWGSAIIEAISNSRAVVAILSGNANDSRQVAREIEAAIHHGLDVIPFRIEDLETSGALAYFLSTAHWIDAFPPPISQYTDQLAGTIQTYLGMEPGPSLAQTKDEDQKSPKKQTQGGFFQRFFGKNVTDVPPAQAADKASPTPEIAAVPSSLKVVDTFEVQSGRSKSVIQFCVGDVTQAAPEQAVDVLVTSAYRDEYYPVPGTVFGALYRKGLSVEDLAGQKEVDLRGAFSCWLSKEITHPPEGIHFKRLLCYEPDENANAGEQIGDIFRSLAPFIGGEDPIRSVGTTLVASGSSRRITQQESLKLLVEAAVHWMSSGLPIEVFKIICLPNQQVDALTHLFSDLKSRFACLTSQRKAQYSYDFFISYSHQDTREVDQFVDLLLDQDRNVRIFIDKQKLNPGSAWQREIYEAIDDCRKVAAFFSSSYLGSKVCLEEFNIALCRHRESETPILKPIFLYSANLPTYMKLIQFFDCRESDRERLQQAASHLISSLSQ